MRYFNFPLFGSLLLISFHWWLFVFAIDVSVGPVFYFSLSSYVDVSCCVRLKLVLLNFCWVRTLDDAVIVSVVAWSCWLFVIRFFYLVLNPVYRCSAALKNGFWSVQEWPYLYNMSISGVGFCTAPDMFPIYFGHHFVISVLFVWYYVPFMVWFERYDELFGYLYVEVLGIVRPFPTSVLWLWCFSYCLRRDLVSIFVLISYLRYFVAHMLFSLGQFGVKATVLCSRCVSW